MSTIHPDFLSLSEISPDILVQADYSTIHNFTGQIVPGYKAKKAYLIQKAALSLAEVQVTARSLGMGLKIYDGYRPVKSVLFFQEWATHSESNQEIKKKFYPSFTRLELFEKGFLAKQSTHSRGCAVDLTLFTLSDGKDLDMGSEFDFFDEISYTDSEKITNEQRENRLLLKRLMTEKGFRNHSKEWWHYSFYPEEYHQAYDFDVE